MAVTATALAGALLAAPIAQAADPDPLERVQVRIEGASKTLFEGPILTRGHAIRAEGDTQDRTCDGTNNGAHPTSGLTPTASAADAISLTGRTFGANWGGFDDYDVNRFAGDANDNDAFKWWGVTVNAAPTSVGGCQVRVAEDDAVTWIHDAFSGRPALRLDGPTGIGEASADGEGGPVTGTVRNRFTVTVGQALPVTTRARTVTYDPVTYEPIIGGFDPADAVAVHDVTTDPATGDQTLGDVLATSDASGAATLTWSTPGWKRIKADKAGSVRSNRIDVCVRADAADTTCDTVPADVAMRGISLPTVSGPVAFGDVATGTAGAVRTVTVTNPDTAPVRVDGVSVAGGAGAFAVDASDCAAPVAGGATCDLQVRFVPSETGARDATLRVRLHGGDVVRTVALSGAGVPAPVKGVPPVVVTTTVTTPAPAAKRIPAASLRLPSSRLTDERYLSVRLRCPTTAGADGCRVTIAADSRHRLRARGKIARRTVGSRTVRLRAGQTKRYRLRTTAAFRRDLRRARTRSVRVRATTRTDAGSRARVRTVWLRHRG